ncbi:MAG: hypothetical protein II838_03825 [Lachnospiraceae bacterium]|nr:hypothetical protein [Lachnospiraceae bacterium]
MKDRNLELFEILGNIEEDYIAESKPHKIKKKNWKVIATAACLGLCIVTSASYVCAEYIGKKHIRFFSQSTYDDKIIDNNVQVSGFETISEVTLDGKISEVRKKIKNYYSQYYIDDYPVEACSIKIDGFVEKYTFSGLNEVNEFLGHNFIQYPVDNASSFDVQVKGNENGKITSIDLFSKFQFKNKTVSTLYTIVTNQVNVINVKTPNALYPYTNFLENQLFFYEKFGEHKQASNPWELTLSCDSDSVLTHSSYKTKQKLETLILQEEKNNQVTTIGLFHVKGCLYIFGIEGELSEKEENECTMKELLDLYHE